MDDLQTIDIAPVAALVGSRLCHDLVSPLGAISNGLELLAMTGTAPSPELALIAEAVADASARVRFLRIAFGHAGADAMVKGREMVEVVQAVYANSRITLDWTPPADLARAEVRTLFLMLNCLDRAMPMGGTAAVVRTGAGRWQITAESARLAYDPDLWAMLQPGGERAGVTPALVQFALLAEDLHRRDAAAMIEVAENRMLFRA